MTTKNKSLRSKIKAAFDKPTFEMSVVAGQLILTLKPGELLSVMTQLKKDKTLQFDQLVDVCGVDYLHYGLGEWETNEASADGFSRAVERNALSDTVHQGARFAVVYHLLSTVHNHRIRVKVMLNEAELNVASVVSIWRSANWFERETYDLYGIFFDGHPDLRRILTDYGFVGYPFRKDFPVSGHVEMRYDAALGKVVYEPVDIEPRTLVPKVIREV